LAVENPEHELVITEVFDVVKDKEQREALFKKIVKQCAK
jgi:hypothetical protein